jgi:predicted PurR-regulated permease PerM
MVEQPSAPKAGKELARLHLWQIQGVRDVVVVALVLGIFYMGYAIRSVTVPLLVAFALAYLVEPVVKGLVRRFGFSRTAAVGTVMGTAGVALVAVVALTVPVLVGQTSGFLKSLREGRFNSAVDRVEQLVPEEYRGEVGRFRAWFQQTTKAEPVGEASPRKGEIAETKEAGDATGAEGDAEMADAARLKAAEAEAQAIQRAVAAELERRGYREAPEQRATGFRWAAVLGANAEDVLLSALEVLTILFLAALVPFYFWFFSLHFPDALAFLRGLLPEKRRDRILELASDMDRAVSGFIRGRIVVSVIMGVVAAIGWRICGVPYAITLGAAVTVLSLIPYVSAITLPLSIGLLAVDQLALPEAERMAWLWIVLAPCLVFGLVQFLEGYVLLPLIAGKATDLDPVSIFVAVLAGAALAGVYGMLLSIPVAACLKIYLREVVMPRLRAWSSGRANDPLPFDQS